MSDGLTRISLPLSPEAARELAVGQVVLLEGTIHCTAGFPAHKRMVEALQGQGALPEDLLRGSFFHMGSSCRAEGDRWLPNYVNPTTSTRFDSLMPRIIRTLGLTATGGKGGMGAECVAALKEVGGVYFSMPGGASPLLSEGATERLSTHWDDLIEQFRLSKFRLEEFGPVTVAIDAHGNSLYEALQDAARARLPGILEGLAERRQNPRR